MKRPSSKPVIPEVISRLKQRARMLKREKGLLHREALEIVAVEAGYPNWHMAVKAAEPDTAIRALRRAQAHDIARQCCQPLDIEMIQKQIGHCSLQMTHFYLKHADTTTAH